MSSADRILNVIFLLSISGLLGACGGGGGGGSSSSGTVGIAASDPVTVSPANATQVAGSTLAASDGLTGNTEGAIGFVPAALGHTRSVQINVIETILEQVRI